MTVQQELTAMKSKFNILKDWKFTVDTQSYNRNQISINPKRKWAVLHPWVTEDNIPDDFYFHEILHVALCALQNTPERERLEAEELLVQDICNITRNWKQS